MLERNDIVKRRERMEQTDTRASKLLDCLDLMEAGIEIIRQTIIRRNPDAPHEFVESELHRWLFEQPDIFIPRNLPKRGN